MNKVKESGSKGTDSFSVSFWTDTNGVNNEILGKMVNDATLRGWGIAVADGQMQFYLINNNGALNRLIEESTSTTLNDGLWHHWAFTYDGSQDRTGVKMYYDGSAIGTSSVANGLTGTSLNNASLIIGDKEGDGSARLVGSLDDVSIFNTKLSSSEIMQLYNNGNSLDIIP